jgi:hypothetical protein
MKSFPTTIVTLLACAALSASPHDPGFPETEALETLNPGAWTMVVLPDTQ